MALLIVVFCFFSFCLIFFPPLYYFIGYWSHVGLTRHILFITSCRGAIIVIDTVTSFPPLIICSRSLLAVWSRKLCVCVFWTSSRLINGCKVRGCRHGLCGCMSVIRLIPLCGMSVMGWQARPWLGVNPTLDKQSLCPQDRKCLWSPTHPA